LAAVNHAVRNRKPENALHFHSDRGIEYAAWAYRQKLVKHGIVQSMNRPGKMNDNAHMESFFHSMKAEYIHGKKFDTDEQLRQTVRRYISFYNHSRIHTSLSRMPPVTFELTQA